jgi:hypothetical protein
LHKIGNKITSATQARYFIDRVSEHATHSKMGSLYVMFNAHSTVSEGGATAYVKAIRAAFPKLKLVYVGPNYPPCKGAEHIITHADKIMIFPSEATWAEFAKSYNFSRVYNNSADISPVLSLKSEPWYGFAAPAKQAKANALLTEFYKITQNPKVNCETVGIWNYGTIASSGSIMGSVQDPINKLAWTKTATVDSPSTETDPGQTEVSEVTLSTLDARLQVVERKLGIV